MQETGRKRQSRYLVRVTLSDGSIINAGGFQSPDSARSRALSWTSYDTFESRQRNGALPVLTAVVLFEGAVVDGFATPSGRMPEMTA